MPGPRTPTIVLVAAAVSATAALAAFGLSLAAPGAGTAAAGLAQPVVAHRPLADARAGWAPRQARLTAADVTHRRVMARAARQLARERARRAAAREARAAALAARRAQRQAQAAAQRQAQPAVAAPAAPSGSGVLSAAQIGRLWLNAGGSAAAESTAICVAEHESGGRVNAVSPTQDYGVWQEHNAPQALNPAVSASMAVQMSSDGTDWSQWTTAASCGV